MLLSRVTSWCFRRRRLVTVLWIVALIGIVVISGVGGADSRDNFALPGTNSQRAYELLGERFPAQAGDSVQVVMKTDGGVVNQPAAGVFDKLITDIAQLGHVTQVDHLTDSGG